jgi:hypothetical protein
MNPQASALSRKIASEESAAVLDALRSWAVGEGCWSDELQAEYDEKRDQLTGRWK